MIAAACHWNWLTGYMPSVWLAALLGVVLALMFIAGFLMGRSR